MKQHTHPLISFIIPAFNEAENLQWQFDALQSFLQKQPIRYEIIYVDDGSADQTLNIIKDLTASHKQVKYISLSRNFGKEVAISAGLYAAEGEAALMLDADGQHPIEAFPKFLEGWQAGNDVVVGIRRSNQGEGFVKRYGSKAFHRLFSVLAGRESMAGDTDFRLLDRKVIEAFKRLPERNRMTRGLIDWLGFKRAYVPFDSPARRFGQTGYHFSKLLRLAVHSFVSQTFLPLRLSGYLGLLIMVISAILGIVLAIDMYLLHDPLHLGVTGTGMLALFLTFLVGVVLGCQGLLALYIESIHTETQDRPLFIVGETNIDEQKY